MSIGWGGGWSVVLSTSPSSRVICVRERERSRRRKYGGASVKRNKYGFRTLSLKEFRRPIRIPTTNSHN